MSATVTLSELQEMHRVSAELVLADPIYLPIFERIEQELAAYDAKNDALARARSVAARYKAAA